MCVPSGPLLPACGRSGPPLREKWADHMGRTGPAWEKSADPLAGRRVPASTFELALKRSSPTLTPMTVECRHGGEVSRPTSPPMGRSEPAHFSPMGTSGPAHFSPMAMAHFSLTRVYTSFFGGSVPEVKLGLWLLCHITTHTQSLEP